MTSVLTRSRLATAMLIEGPLAGRCLPVDVTASGLPLRTLLVPADTSAPAVPVQRPAMCRYRRRAVESLYSDCWLYDYVA